MPDTSVRPIKPPLGRGRTLAAMVTAVLIVLLVTGGLYARAALSEDSSEKVPLTVVTTSFSQQEYFKREASYLGLVTSGQKARLGFEVPGQIATLPVRQGSEVKKGAVIATLDDSSLLARRRAIAADLEQAHAELELARLRSKRQKSLSTSGAVSKEAYDETRLRARALASQVEATEARLESIDIDLGKARLVAPYDGVIADKFLHPGAVVAPGAPVVRLLQTGIKEAHIGVSASRASALVPGQQYRLLLRKEPLNAELLSVRADVDPATRAAMAVFALPGKIVALDGQPIHLTLEEDVPSTGGWLPISALLEGHRGLWTVLRIEQQGGKTITVREAVEVLEIQGDRAFVRGSLNSGAIVVADGVHRITAGSPVILAEQH